MQMLTIISQVHLITVSLFILKSLTCVAIDGYVMLSTHVRRCSVLYKFVYMIDYIITYIAKHVLPHICYGLTEASYYFAYSLVAIIICTIKICFNVSEQDFCQS